MLMGCELTTASKINITALEAFQNYIEGVVEMNFPYLIIYNDYIPNYY